MTLTIRADPVPLRLDVGGAIRIGQTRVTLETLIGRFHQGYSPEHLADAFDTLQLADIYAVIGYYLRHRSEVDAYLKQVDEGAETIRRKIEARPGYQEFRERLLARRAAPRGT